MNWIGKVCHSDFWKEMQFIYLFLYLHLFRFLHPHKIYILQSIIFLRYIHMTIYINIWAIIFIANSMSLSNELYIHTHIRKWPYRIKFDWTLSCLYIFHNHIEKLIRIFPLYPLLFFKTTFIYIYMKSYHLKFESWSRFINIL